MKTKLEKSKHATDLGGLCIIHDSTGAHTYKLVQDFLESETVVQLHNPPYSTDVSPCDFFMFILLKTNLSRRRYKPRSALGIAIVLRLETAFPSREN